MPESLQEFVNSGGHALQLDRRANVLRGVKLLGLKSRNKRVYREEALRKAMNLYEGARVNVNHPKGDPLGPRDYQDRLGVVRNVELRAGEGLFGTLHFNPQHALAEQLIWDADNAPENVGLSHNVVANTSRQGSQVVVEAILHVQSVDLVADPATTAGLFEHAEVKKQPDLTLWKDLSIEQIELHRPDLLASLAEQHQQQLQTLTQRIDRLTTEAQDADQQRRAYALLAEHGLRIQCTTLPHTATEVGRAFVDALVATQDEDAMRKLVSDQAELVREASRSNRAAEPRSKEQLLDENRTSYKTASVNEFVAAVAESR